IAVDGSRRGENLGTELLNKGIEETKSLGGRRMYLVARAPEFFRKNGFVTIPREEAPNFFECLTCPQYGKTCHPEVMKIEF
ncbi:MAG: GNAT family N-acetyltransferase, partial [Lentihominibacter sp.]